MVLGCGCSTEMLRTEPHRPECRWPDVPAFEYPGVRNWYTWMHSGDTYVAELVELARKQGAPFDALYPIRCGVWRTVSDENRMRGN